MQLVAAIPSSGIDTFGPLCCIFDGYDHLPRLLLKIYADLYFSRYEVMLLLRPFGVLQLLFLLLGFVCP